MTGITLRKQYRKPTMKLSQVNSISNLMHHQVCYGRKVSAISTLFILLIYSISKGLNERSMVRSSVGKKFAKDLTSLVNSIRDTVLVSHGYRLLRSQKTEIVQYYDWIQQAWVAKPTTGLVLSKSSPNELQTLDRYCRMILSYTGGEMSVLLKAFSDLPDEVSDLLKQAATDPNSVAGLLDQHTEELANYKALSALKGLRPQTAKAEQQPPADAVIQLSSWEKSLHDWYTSLGAREKAKTRAAIEKAVPSFKTAIKK